MRNYDISCLNLSNLDNMVTIRSYDHDTKKEFYVEVNFIDAIKNPSNLNCADIGWHLMNLIRIEMGLERLSYDLLSK